MRNALRNSMFCSALALFCMAGDASALTQTLNHEGFSFGSVSVEVQGKANNSPFKERVLAGAFDMRNETTDENLIAWCIDLLSTLKPSAVYNQTDFLVNGVETKVHSLFEANQILDDYSLTEMESAGFQLAIWDVIYDDDWNVSTKGSDNRNWFRVKNAPIAVVDTANQFLYNASDFQSGNSYEYVQYDGSFSDTQGLIVANEVPNVPLPIPLVLLGTGIIGLGVYVTRNR